MMGKCFAVDCCNSWSMGCQELQFLQTHEKSVFPSLGCRKNEIKTLEMLREENERNYVPTAKCWLVSWPGNKLEETVQRDLNSLGRIMKTKVYTTVKDFLALAIPWDILKQSTFCRNHPNPQRRQFQEASLTQKVGAQRFFWKEGIQRSFAFCTLHMSSVKWSLCFESSKTCCLWASFLRQFSYWWVMWVNWPVDAS